MRSLARLLLIAAVAVAGVVPGTPVAQAATTVTGVGALYTGSDPAYPTGTHRFGDSLVVQGSSSGRFTVTVTGSQPFAMTFDPPIGRRFGVGRYTVDDSAATAERASVDVYVGSSSDKLTGEVQVLDWALGANGAPSRFDIVFHGPYGIGVFGQLRMGQDAGERVAVASTRPTWGVTPVRSVPVVATEWLHNVSAGPVTIGAAAVSGAAKGDWTVASDGCSGRTLAAGARCSLRVGFSPQQGGPRLATLSIPIAGVTKQVSLAGTGAQGTTKITFSGDDRVSLGTAHAFVDGGPTVLQGWRMPTGYLFHDAVAYGSRGADIVDLHISGPGGTRPTVGKHVVDQGGSSTLDLTVTGSGSAFGYTKGTATVRRFDVDAADRPVAADVDFVLWDAWDAAHPMTGTLRWRVRTDYTAPASPTALSLSASGTVRTARWTASASGDRALSIARLVPGDGAGAGPTSGYPVSAGTATSAVLPSLRAGQVYTLVVFATDAAGNASKPARLTVQG